MLAAVVLWIVLVNAWTVLRFCQDKARAIAGGWRVPEADLLSLAIIGGSPGAFAARWLFRHKTRKELFSTRLQTIAAVQIGVVATALFL